MIDDDDTPDSMAARIVAEHCQEMDPGKREAILRAIEEAINSWGNFCDRVSLETIGEYL